MAKHIFSTVLCLLLVTSLISQTKTPSPLPPTPLRAIFLDAGNVINDGKTNNTIEIGIFNTNLPSTSKTGGNDFVFPAKSEIMIGFPIDPGTSNETPTRPWSLTTADRYSNVAITVYGENDTTPDKTNWTTSLDSYVGQNWRYFIASPNTDITLKPGQFIKIRLESLVTNLKDGHASAVLYFDSGKSQVINTVFGSLHKSPLYVTGEQVAISSNDKSTATLNVNGGIHTRGGGMGLVGSLNNGYAFSHPGDNDSGFTSEQDGNINFYVNGTSRAMFQDLGNGYSPLQLYNGLYVNPNLDFQNTSAVVNDIKLISFGKHQQYRFSNLAEGHFGHPTLAIKAQNNTSAMGFYSFSGNQNTPNLEVNTSTGDTYIRRSLRIGGTNANTETPALSIGGQGQLSVDAPGKPGGRFVVRTDGKIRVGGKPAIIRINKSGGGENNDLNEVDTGIPTAEYEVFIASYDFEDVNIDPNSGKTMQLKLVDLKAELISINKSINNPSYAQTIKNTPPNWYLFIEMPFEAKYTYSVDIIGIHKSLVGSF